jgi:hypothetical protein
MNQNLVEYKGQTYNNGLTVDEKAYLHALEQTQIQDSTLPMFKALIAKGIVISGIKELPSVEETQLLYDTIQQFYRFFTIGELGLAFQLNAVGQTWKRVEHYGLMSIQFLSDVLNSYKVYKMQMNLDIERKKAKLVIGTTMQDDEPADYKAMFESDLVRWKENNRYSVLLLAPSMMRKFEAIGAIDPNCWSDDDWKRYRFMAFQKVCEERNLTNYQATKMLSKEKRDFELLVRAEILRHLYADIMDSHILQQRIIEKL